MGDLQRDALLAAGVDVAHLYEDRASGKQEDRLGLTGCLKVLGPGDTLIAWELNRLGRELRYLIDIVRDLTTSGAGNLVYWEQPGKRCTGIFLLMANCARMG